MTHSIGTNTDCVLLDVHARGKNLANSPSGIGNNTETPQAVAGVVASFKTETTADVTSGIELAVRRVLEMCGVRVGYGGGTVSEDYGGERILSLTIGTTVCFFFWRFFFYGKKIM